MANTVRLKRSAVQGKAPTTSDLELGELALNTYDGKLYTKKDDGTASIVELSGSVVSDLDDLTDVTISSPSDDQFLRYDGSGWVNETYTPPVVSVNGSTGSVVLDTDDIGEGTTNLYSQWDDVTGGINYAGGNVGIGTTSPARKLDVDGAIESSSTIYGVTFAGTNDTDTFIKFPGSDVTEFYNGNSERARIDGSGRLLVGTSTYRPVGTPFAPTEQIYCEGAGLNHYEVFVGVHGRNSDTGPVISLGKTRSGSKGGNTIVQNGDELGVIRFSGADGVDLQSRGAEIICYVDGTPGANDMPGSLVFSTTADGGSSPTGRMRIRQDGSIDTITDAGVTFYVRNKTTTASDVIFGCLNSATVLGNGTTAFLVRGDGDCENTNNSYGAISDIKLKENIVDAGSQWNDLRSLQIRKYNFKPETGYGTHTQIGLIAQEVETVSPGLVSESPDRDEDGNDLGTVTKSVNYSVLYMKAVKALQEAMERIETLEQRLDDAGL